MIAIFGGGIFPLAIFCNIACDAVILDHILAYIVSAQWCYTYIYILVMCFFLIHVQALEVVVFFSTAKWSHFLKKVLLYCFVTLGSIFKLSAVQVSHLFNLKGFLLTGDPVWIMQAFATTHCARICQFSTSVCRLFNYNHITGQCVGFSSESVVQAGQVAEKGWSLWKIIQWKCDISDSKTLCSWTGVSLSQVQRRPWKGKTTFY